MPHDFAARIACLWATGIFVVFDPVDNVAAAARDKGKVHNAGRAVEPCVTRADSFPIRASAFPTAFTNVSTLFKAPGLHHRESP